MKELKASKEFAIRFSEVDSMNVVWHGSYSLYFEIYDTEDNSLIATGSSVQVFMDLNYQLVWDNPSFYQEWKERWGQVENR